MTPRAALNKLFSDSKKNKSALFRMWRSRHKQLKLSLDKQEKILNENGFEKLKEAVWAELKKH